MAKKQTQEISDEVAVTKVVSAEEQRREEILDTLAELGGQSVREDAIVREGQRFVIPETMSDDDAEKFLKNYRKSRNEITSFSRTFDYKPWDVAHALQAAMMRTFGSAGVQQATWGGFFGTTKEPPEQRTIAIGYKKSTQVPWGAIDVPIFKGTLYLGGEQHPELGSLGQITIEAAKRYQPECEGLFTKVQHELENNSIYRGKAIDGQQMPGFIDLRSVQPDRVIYSQDVKQQLEANIWSLLRHSETMRELNVPLKRSVLLEGDYGTGKTLTAFLTALIAVENGWTFVYCRPGKDKLVDVMTTARLYQPAVVFFEDVDTIGNGEQERDAVTELLDIFDGINAKGTELLAIVTTNHKERIHKGMVRPGRLDSVIHIGALDHAGIQRMIEATVDAEVLDNLDYTAIGNSMEGYLPAFIKEAIDRTMRYAVAREGCAPTSLTTEDFVLAADGLRDQLDLMTGAKEGVDRVTLEVALANTVGEVLGKARILAPNGDFPELKIEV